MKKTIVTISRETGSGGHTIGMVLAERLGFKLYDEEIVTQISKESGMSEEMVLENGEFMSDGMFLDFAAGFVPFSRKKTIPFEEIQEREENLIKKIAKEGNYHYFTNKDWGMVENYNMTLDTSIFTKTQCTDLIIEALKKLEENEDAKN